MNCAQAENWIIQGVFEEVTSDQKQELQRHLDQCAGCQALAAKYVGAVAALEEKSELFRDPYMASRVVHLAQEQTAQREKKPVKQWWFSAVASAAVLALVIVITPQWISTPASPTTQETLDAYMEDISTLGFWEDETNGESFDYENYGVPTDASQYMI
jgi:anti-sigma factor RsiW